MKDDKSSHKEKLAAEEVDIKPVPVEGIGMFEHCSYLRYMTAGSLTN